jgi:glycosyltransferase involved in cell wall biosynthesis
LIEVIGAIREDRKDEFLGNALALVFSIDWPEPFGLVLIEAMAWRAQWGGELHRTIAASQMSKFP